MFFEEATGERTRRQRRTIATIRLLAVATAAVLVGLFVNSAFIDAHEPSAAEGLAPAGTVVPAGTFDAHGVRHTVSYYESSAGLLCARIQADGERDNSNVCTKDGFAFASVGVPGRRVLFGLAPAQAASVDVLEAGDTKRALPARVASEEVQQKLRTGAELRWFGAEVGEDEISVAARTAGGQVLKKGQIVASRRPVRRR